MITLAVIIVSWNVRDLLDRCLQTLQQDLTHTAADAHVWVVDNASEDGSAEMVQARHPWVSLELPGENIGFVRGNNLILDRLCQGNMPDFVWLLNPDTEVQTGATQTLLDTFRSIPRAGLIGPRLYNSDGSLQHSAFRFPGLFQPLMDLGMLPLRFYESRLNGRYLPKDYAKHTPFRVDYPLGAAMMGRGAAIKEVGALDEAFFMYCEEIDWAWRMRKMGWQTWLVPQAGVTHHGGASSSQARPQTTAHLWKSRARLYRKHRQGVQKALVGAMVRRHFRRALSKTTDPEWRAAFEGILQAWN
ncbi:MAG: glycosyltransferase family 2 protein [Anaerolineae bacterium]|jgi:GT2 family glycosyltransferase|nr:glycosyltransferase family 2 protein [Anaerolineae bacterium]